MHDFGQQSFVLAISYLQLIKMVKKLKDNEKYRERIMVCLGNCFFVCFVFLQRDRVKGGEELRWGEREKERERIPSRLHAQQGT